MTLAEILNTMDVPEQRKSDRGWLLRNLAVRNAGHPHFAAAIKLLKKG